MKRIVILIALCLVGYVTLAQDVDDVNNAAYVNKRGIYLLPQAGDFALGIDASPLLRYVGNAFSSYGNNAPILSNNTLYGKYFLDDNRAIRAKMYLSLSNIVNKGYLRDNGNPDIQSISNSDVGLSVGYELRRGNGRVQGFFGGEVYMGYGGGKVKYEYTNRMDDDYIETYDFSYFDPRFENWISYSERITEEKFGKTISAGMGGFAGIEYFFAPQISIGCEFGLGLIFSTTLEGKTTSERWEDDERKVRTVKGFSGQYRPNARNIFGGTDEFYSSASIFLMFHF